MWTCDRLRQLIEQRLLHLCELAWIHDFENVFDLVKEHDLFGTIHLGPVSQQAKDNLDKSVLSSCGIIATRLPLLSELHPFRGTVLYNMLIEGDTCSSS